MSDQVLLAALALIGTLANAVIGVIVLYISRGNSVQAKSTHELVNSQTAALLSAATGEAGAQGFTAGEQAQRDRAAAPPGE